MQRKKIIVILLGLIIAAGSSYGMLKANQNLQKTVPVVVIKQIIQPYEEFTTANVEIREVLERYYLPSAINTLSEVMGKKASVTLYPGEQVRKERICRRQMDAAAEEKFLFIKTDDVLMIPGQLVDIYTVFNAGRNIEPQVEQILSGKMVATVIDESGNNIFKNDWPKAVTRRISGIEIIVTQEEILRYLKNTFSGKSIIIRH